MGISSTFAETAIAHLRYRDLDFKSFCRIFNSLPVKTLKASLATMLEEGRITLVDGFYSLPSRTPIPPLQPTANEGKLAKFSKGTKKKKPVELFPINK